MLKVTEEVRETKLGPWRCWASGGDDHRISIGIPDSGRSSDAVIEMRELVLRMLFALSGENGQIEERFPEGGGVIWGGRLRNTITGYRKMRGEIINVELEEARGRVQRRPQPRP